MVRQPTERDESGQDDRGWRVAQSGSKAHVTTDGFRDLGVTPLARQLGLNLEQTNGHWCSRCEGIWFGYTLECECPACGNRKG